MSTTETSGGPAARETHKFQAEVNQVLHLVINSLYSHKEIFLRELISNASDALDKLRFRAITEPDLLAGDASLEIRIIPDREAGTLTIEDTGIGMSHDELVENLGTVARSGSRAFLDALRRSGGRTDELSLIGQFGVGFYSSYLVADRVEVESSPATTATGEAEPHGWRWISDAHDTFIVEPAERRARGTAVRLHLREDQRQFLEEWTLRDLIKRYSDYVSYPILLRVEARPPFGEEAEEGAEKKAQDAAKPEPKLEKVNQASALWRRAKSDITDEQYEEFYQHLTHDFEKPLARTHFKVEGTNEFTGLLFLPRKPPFDLHLDVRRRGIRLFVRRVFVMDDCEELLPDWLRFVRGVVDSDDLPLNVSRETLQDSQVVRAIRKQVIKKSLDLLDEVARDKADDYLAFWKAFGPVFKAGLHMDFEHRDRIAELVRYRSSKSDGWTSLKEYVARMSSGQEAIYYAFGESEAMLAGSPHIEALRKRGFEVLYMTDPIDEWAVEALREYDKKKLVSAMREDLKLGQTDEEKKQHEAEASAVSDLLGRMRAVLQDRVEEVRVSDRLTDSPACLVVPEGGHHAPVERLLRSHGAKIAERKRILEVNATHPLITSLQSVVAREPASERAAEWIEMIYDQALLTEGSPLVDPQRFARRLTALLTEVARLQAPPASA